MIFLRSVIMQYHYLEEGFRRASRKAALLGLIRQAKRKYKRSVIKRCGLSPTDSLLFTYLTSLLHLIIKTHEKVFTGRVHKRLTKSINLVLSKADEPADVMATAIKTSLGVSLGCRIFEYSISKLKSCFSDSTAVKVLTPAALEKHKKTLSVPVARINDEDLKRTIQITRDLLLGVSYDFDRVPKIGRKSCLEMSCADGGKQQALSELLSTTMLELENSWLPTIVVTSTDGARQIPFCRPFRDTTLSTFEVSVDERQLVKVAVVPGPLKARVITKETCLNFFLEATRRGVWKKLRTYDIFCIDGPVKCDDIPRRSPGEIYVSGDYTAATDAFHPEVSEAICRVIADTVCEHLYEELPMCERTIEQVSGLREVLKTTMTGKTIEYPSGDTILQRRGQLMGNLMSFPVLCIYNYAVWHICMERYHQRLLPLQHNVRINGDDILFPASLGKYEVWRDGCNELGMELNDLKTQLSKRYCSLNSQLFTDRKGAVTKIFGYRTFGAEVSRDEARRLNEEERKLCGDGAPGIDLFVREASADRPPKIEKELYQPDGMSVIKEWFFGYGKDL